MGDDKKKGGGGLKKFFVMVLMLPILAYAGYFAYAKGTHKESTCLFKVLSEKYAKK